MGRGCLPGDWPAVRRAVSQSQREASSAHPWLMERLWISPSNFLLTSCSDVNRFTGSHYRRPFSARRRSGRGFLPCSPGFRVLGALWTARWGRSMLASVFAARRTTAHVAQSVEHLHGKQKVSGSIPLVGSITRIANGRVFRKVLSTSPLVF